MIIFSSNNGYEKRQRSHDFAIVVDETKRRLHELRNEHRYGDALREKQAEFFCNEMVRLRYACKVLRAGASDNEIRSLSEKLNVFAKNTEKVEWYLKPKSSGRGVRPICIVPPLMQAKHRMVASVLLAAMPENDHLYGIPGRGPNVAIERIISSLEGGFEWCWTGDIRDCFQRVCPAELKSCLPLSGTIVRHLLDYRNIILSPRAHPSYSGDGDRSYEGMVSSRHWPTGLFQGAASSNIILALLLISMADAVDLQGSILIVYADNIFVAAKTEDVRNEVVAKVRSYLTAHPAGRFRLHKEEFASPKQPFEMLGYRFEWNGNVIDPQPTGAAMERIMQAFQEAQDDDIMLADGTIPHTEKITRSYQAAYPFWSDAASNSDAARHFALQFASQAKQIAEYEWGAS